MFTARRILYAVLLMTATAATASDWHAYAGGFGTRWRTAGPHGHDQPLCDEARSGGCDENDFSRGNLDDSIGFRAGLEREFWSTGRLHLLYGGDASVSYTEYNLSQRDFALLTGALLTGADYDLGRVRLGVRVGAGPFATTNGRALGLIGSREVALTLPVRPGAALRISSRSVDTFAQFGTSRAGTSPSAVESAVMLVASPDLGGTSPWEFAAATGTTQPGLGLGGDRKLRTTEFTRVSASRQLPWHGLQLDVTWTSTAHESSQPTVFRGYDDNFRSKTIEAYGFGVSRSHPVGARLTLRYGAGVEVADWHDEHQLLTRDGRELVAGIELAPSATVALRLAIAPHLALDASLQKVYWQGLDLSEGRVAFGLVLTR